MKERIFNEVKEANKYVTDLLAVYKEIKIAPYRRTRTLQQNRALHLYFQFIADELNEFTSFSYNGLMKDFEIPYTMEIVKQFIWKPIQIAMFGKTSTTKITTQEINKIIDVINKYFAEKGISITFPSWESYSRLVENY